MRIALLTRSYPSQDNLYQYPFVHRRVVAYRALGHEVRVLRLAPEEGEHIFDGVECRAVPATSFSAAVAAFEPHIVAVHGPDEGMWPAIAALEWRWPICAWLHGSEIPAFFREKAQRIADPALRDATLTAVSARAAFWREALSPWPNGLNLAFVSQDSIGLMRRDLGDVLRDDGLKVLHNPIDTDLFAYRAKDATQRLNVLSIRPYDSPTYGNDMAVAAVLALASHSAFPAMRFNFIGDGPLFDETLAPLRGLANVTIDRRFVRQEEIAALHRENGVFLVPTRLDTQGVSRDEAMASGLVPVTNSVFAVPEFVDERCAGLASADDAEGLAREIAAMVDDPALFLARSAAAAARVRRQSAHGIVIPQELAWMERCAQV